MTLLGCGPWETQSLENTESFIVQKHLTKVLRLPEVKMLLYMQL